MTSELKEQGKQIRFKFLSVLSHELKSPLNAIEGYLRIMEDKQAGDNIEDYMPMIDRSLVRIQSMRNLIMDMLDLTRLESGKKKRHIHEVDMKEMTLLAIDTVKPMAIQQNIRVLSELDAEMTFKADPDEIEIILNNLLSNAVKYNREGGEVRIVVGKEENCLKITVADTGIGIIPKLFEEFSRIKTNETRNITGTGLGLSITKKMVELYDGSINVISKPNFGTTFKIRLPIKL